MNTSIDPTDTNALERAHANEAERHRLKEQQRVEDLKWWVSSKRGRRMAFEMLESAGVYRSSFNTNAATMAFNEGQRNAGLRLLADLTTYAPERYSEMLEESKK